MVIFKSESTFFSGWLPSEMYEELAGWQWATSPSGWTSDKIAVDWLDKIFIPLTRPQEPAQRRLLIVDGHGSHVTPEFIAKCMQNAIDLMVLPAHTSHITQPLDVGPVTTTAFSAQGPAGTYSERSAWGSLTWVGMSELGEELGEGLAELKEVNGLSEECGEGLAELGEQEGELDERERVEEGRWGSRRGARCHWQAKRRDGAGGLRVCREQQLGEDYGTYRAPSLPKYPSSLGPFAPLKIAMSNQALRANRYDPGRVQKVDFVRHLVQARQIGMTADNIRSGWRSSGLWPFAPMSVIRRLEIPATPAQEASQVIPTTLGPAESLADETASFLRLYATLMRTPIKIRVQELSVLAERLQSRNLLLELEIQQYKTRETQRKTARPGRMVSYFGTHSVSTQEVYEKAVELAAASSRRKKKSKDPMTPIDSEVSPEEALFWLESYAENCMHEDGS